MNKEKTGPTTQELLNALRWTQERHPTRESLIGAVPPEPVEPSCEDIYVKNEMDKSPFWKMLGGGTYTDVYQDYLNEIDKRYEALAKLEIWDAAFGPKTEHFTQFYHDPASVDPAVTAAAKAKQAHLDNTIAPRLTPKQELFLRRNSQDNVKDPVVKFIIDSVKQDNKPSDSLGVWATSPVSYFFDAYPENKNAMEQLRKAHCTSDIMQYGDRYIPNAYLCLTYTTERFLDAVRAISQDLKLLADRECIVGNLGLPSTMQLFIDSLTVTHALYCWPFIDYEKLAKSVGKDFFDDFACEHNELLRFVGVKNVVEEGGLGNTELTSPASKETTA